MFAPVLEPTPSLWHNIVIPFVATDLSPVSVALLKANAMLHDRTIEIQCEDAETTTLKPNEFLNIDPDRRATGKRVTALDGLQPNWLVVKRLIDESQGASMKVAPATDWGELDAKPDTIRYLSRDRSVRQQRWLWNLNRWPAESIVVSVHIVKTGFMRSLFNLRTMSTSLENR